MIMKGFEYGATKKSSTCVAEYMAENYLSRILNQMNSAGVYGEAGNNYGSHVMVHSMGSMLSKATNSCDSSWDKFWDKVFNVAEEIITIAVDICKVAKPIAEGLEIVTAGESSVVVGTCEAFDEISDGEKLLKEADNVI